MFRLEALMPLAWLAATVALLVLEGATVQLVAIWFACGAAAAVLCALLGMPALGQVGVFLAVSALLLALTRPLVRRLSPRGHLPTNADRMIGRVARVTQQSQEAANEGRILLDGVGWAARAAGGEALAAGDWVRVVAIEGATALVQPAGRPDERENEEEQE